MILALPHLGGWEWAGRWLVDLGHGLTVVVERLDPPELFDWFADLRGKLGMKVVALGPSAGREVIAALHRNDIVCLLCDRDIQRNGVEVEFFGETHDAAGWPGDGRDADRRPDPADRRLLHRPLDRPPRPGSATAAARCGPTRACTPTCCAARKRWRTSWNTWCDERRSSGTCSSRTGPAILATDETAE